MSAKNIYYNYIKYENFKSLNFVTCTLICSSYFSQVSVAQLITKLFALLCS